MTPDLQRALAEIDRMIEETREYMRPYDDLKLVPPALHIARFDALHDARSRLSALATTHGERQ